MVTKTSRFRDWPTALALFLLFGAVYLFSTGAHGYSVDDITNYASARFLVEYGSPELRLDDPFPSSQLMKAGHPGNGRVTGRYGLLAWLPLVPLYGLATVTGPSPEGVSSTFPEPSSILPLVVLLYNPVVAAALIALTFLLARRIGLKTRYAIAAALIAGFGSPIWVYAKTLSSIPLAAALTLAALLALTQARGQRVWPFAASGLAAGLAAAVRPDYGLLVVALIPFALLAADAGLLRRLWRASAWLLAWAVVVVPGVGIWNLYRTGSMLQAGYADQTFLWQTSKPYIGLFGIVASPSFGLLVFMPIGAIGLWGLLSGSGSRSVRYVMASLALMAIVGYGTFNDWNGGVSWGPRYLTGIVPLLAIGVGSLLQNRSIGVPGLLVVALTALWGVAISVLGVLFDYQNGWRNLWDVGAKPEQILWDPHFSLIGAHLRLLAQWRDGLIGLDLYMTHMAGLWAVAVLVGVVALIAAAWLALELRWAALSIPLLRILRRTYNS